MTGRGAILSRKRALILAAILLQFRNGGGSTPQPDDILVLDAGLLDMNTRRLRSSRSPVFPTREE